MKRMFFLACLLILLLPQAVSADIIYLKNGNTYEGQIIKEDDEKLAVKTTIMTIILSKDEVEAIQRDYPSSDSRLGAGEKFDITDVLRENDEVSGIKVIQKEDTNID